MPPTKRPGPGRAEEDVVELRARIGVVVLAAVTLVALLGGGSAMASWLSGPATGGPGISVTAGAPTGGLYPEPAGGYPTPDVGAVVVHVTNSGDAAVRLTSATVGAVTVTPLPGRTCAAGSVAPATAGPVTLARAVDLRPGATDVPVALPGALTMAGTAEEGCQGASIRVEVSLTGSGSGR
jgi:hypothetical protein